MIMTEVPETAAAMELTTEDLERNPAQLLKMIGGSGNQRGSQQRWILVGTGSRRNAAILRATVNMAGRMLDQRRRELTERNIEALLDLFLQGEERADIDRELEQDNAELRARYLREVPTCTAAEIHDFLHGLRLRNPSEPASRWKREKRVFAVRVDRKQLFPRFQFADGHPRPVVREILKRLPADMTPWQTAFWFWSGNGWLDGESPETALGDQDRVLEAASRLREPAVG